MLQNRRDVDQLVRDLADYAVGYPVPQEALVALVNRAKALVNAPEPPEYAKYREAAMHHRLLRDGELEVDDNAIVSDDQDDDESIGAYVEAWLWIDNEEAGIATKEDV
jgi:hypothetical protein